MSDELPPGVGGERTCRSRSLCWPPFVNLPAVREPLTRDDDLFLRLRLQDSATIPDYYGKVHFPAGPHRFGAVVHRHMDGVGPPPAATPRTLMESGLYPGFADEGIQSGPFAS